ncbi:hypothetical protein LIER_28316 [Lithospermum erythrorhizon]|uniref:Plastid lipid-associated protein/fibrillin conserved domain-containing protein n=1 Tax=Lithospermum erythrorhizon TaxID=34254 RepID=A0AAV3RH65_LITER
MASVPSINQFSYNLSSKNPSTSSKISILPPNLINLKSKFTPQSPISTIKKSQTFSIKSSIESNSTSDEKGPLESSRVGVLEAEEPKELSEVEILKKKLVDTFYGTNRGLSATTETRAEIVEFISQLEAVNPTPNPTDALPLLNGKWILAYTSFAGLYPLLSRGTLPLVKLEEISQTIDSENFTVQNSVKFAGPLASTSISANAKFEVRSPKRVQIKFEEGIIGTPQLTDSIEFPENVEFLGQKIDLTPFKGVISSVQDSASSVARTVSSQPPLKFSISNRITESWLLTTYLDEELRISRGDGGSVFVLIKEGSPLLKP